MAHLVSQSMTVTPPPQRAKQITQLRHLIDKDELWYEEVTQE